MFQYISDILKQFSPTQKMLALVILLISIVSISYITMITKTPDELTKTVSIQRQAILDDQKHINNLSQLVNNLNDSLLDSNQDCNSKAIEREKVFNKEMVEQQQYVTATIEEIKGLLNSKNPKKQLTVLKSVSIESQEQTVKYDTIVQVKSTPVYKVKAEDIKTTKTSRLKSIFSIFSSKSKKYASSPVSIDSSEMTYKYDTIITKDTIRTLKTNKHEPETVKLIEQPTSIDKKIMEKLNKIKNVKSKGLNR